MQGLVRDGLPEDLLDWRLGCDSVGVRRPTANARESQGQPALETSSGVLATYRSDIPVSDFLAGEACVAPVF